MKKFEGFEKGLGIGGWLTNYKRFNVIPPEKRFDITVGDMEHFNSYIIATDIRYIASLGFDHVRVGFDQIVVEESPFVYRESIFELLRNFISWTERFPVNVIFNLHKAIGNYCDIREESGLFDSLELQNRFVALWIEFEKRFSDKPNIVFELLNEVKDVPAEKWNALAKRAIEGIRDLNPERKIMIGSTRGNSPDTLADLDVYDDENVIYTFHFYTPFEFTHQQGVLMPNTLYYNRRMEYPAPIDKYREYRECIGKSASIYDNYQKMDKEYLKDAMKGALDFIKAHPDKILTCGEFGTIRHCNVKYRENWMRDVISILKENEIPYTAWNYLSTPNDGNKFSLVDDDNRQILSKEMHRILMGKV